MIMVAYWNDAGDGGSDNVILAIGEVSLGASA